MAGKSSLLEGIAFNWHFMNKFSWVINLKDVRGVNRAVSRLSMPTSSPIVEIEMTNASTIEASRRISDVSTIQEVSGRTLHESTVEVNRGMHDRSSQNIDILEGQDSDDED